MYTNVFNQAENSLQRHLETHIQILRNTLSLLKWLVVYFKSKVDDKLALHRRKYQSQFLLSNRQFLVFLGQFLDLMRVLESEYQKKVAEIAGPGTGRQQLASAKFKKIAKATRIGIACKKLSQLFQLVVALFPERLMLMIVEIKNNPLL